MKTKILIFIVSCIVIVAGCTKDTMKPKVIPVVANVSFTTSVYPIFSTYSCTDCHGDGGAANLNLSGTHSDVRTSLLHSDTPAVIPDSSAVSKLYTNFNGVSHNGKTLTTTEVTNIKSWIDEGAKDN